MPVSQGDSAIANYNPKRENLKRFGIEQPVKAGPGRPAIPREVKDAIAEAKRILKDASPVAAARLLELCHSKYANVAVAAAKAILEKTVPTQEEVNLHDTRPVERLPDEQLSRVLKDLVAGAENPSHNGHNSGNGVKA